MPSITISNTVWIRQRYNLLSNKYVSATATGSGSTLAAARINGQAAAKSAATNVVPAYEDWNVYYPVVQTNTDNKIGQYWLNQLYDVSYTEIRNYSSGGVYYSQQKCTGTHYDCLYQCHLQLNLSGITTSLINTASITFTISRNSSLTYRVCAPASTLSNPDSTYYPYDDSALSNTQAEFTIPTDATSITVDITNQLKQCITSGSPYLIITSTRTHPHTISQIFIDPSNITINYSKNLVQKFNANGGFFGNDTTWADQIRSTSETGTLATFDVPAGGPMKYGYRFLGWSSSSTATAPYSPVSVENLPTTINLSADRTWYAVWEITTTKPVYIKINGTIHEALPYIKTNGTIHEATFTVKTS